jgi:chorismate mutase/prephenate dehydratase
LVGLLNTRVRLAQRIGRLKRRSLSETYVPAREKEVFARVKRLNRGPIGDAALQAVYREIMSASLATESRIGVGYLGPPSSLGHEAARGRFGDSVNYVPFWTVKDVFDAVEKQSTHYGVVPTADSVEGSAVWTLHCFWTSPAKICAEIWSPVSHHLLCRRAGARIRRVYGHPRALGNCRHWLRNRMPDAKPVPVASTAAAAALAASDAEGAAIGGELAGKRYGLTLVASAIHSGDVDAERFLVISRRHGRPSGDDKTSLLFSVGSEPGALCRLLESLKRYRLNVVGVESAADRRNPDRVFLWLDVAGHEADGPMAKALARLFTVCGSVRVLGSYPSGR